jgi:vacuolar-type H+-ATPase subunit H
MSAQTEHDDPTTAGLGGEGDGDDAAVLQASIEHTRAEMSGTLEAIQERLGPETLKEQAVDVVQETAEQVKTVATTAIREAGEQARDIVREATTQAKSAVHDATIGKAEEAVDGATRTVKGMGATMLETIKQNPLPAAMAGIGLGWLFMKTREAARSERPMQMASTADVGAYPYGGGYAYDYDYGSNRSDMIDDDQGAGVREPAGRLTDQAKTTAGEVGGQAKETVSGAVDQVTDAAGEMVSQAQAAAGRVAGAVQNRTGRVAGGTGDRFQRMLEESPLVLGGVALAAGAAVGRVLPTTDPANKLRGPARDDLLQQAQATAKDLQPAVERAAAAAQQAVQETVQTESNQRVATAAQGPATSGAPVSAPRSMERGSPR